MSSVALPTSSLSAITSDWDPITNSDEKVAASTHCLLRIKRDMMSIYNEPPPGLFVVPDEKDMTIIHALITGSFDTPYEGGFFYFLVRCPPDYPIRPPRVKLMTTGAGTERCPGDIGRYNDIIQHETLRVAVCGMLENDTCLAIPEALCEVMEKTFLEFYDYYESTVRKKLHLHGQHMQDPFGEERGSFQYRNILTRLQALHDKLGAKSNPIGNMGDKTTSDNECSSEDSDLEQPQESSNPVNS
ncbi:Ubiquitin-conjugating enzyme E2 Z [Blattella germanica]|nr:Ubiquitin-conjugating enzyme E2 Z [Blattella germanica]